MAEADALDIDNAQSEDVTIDEQPSWQESAGLSNDSSLDKFNTVADLAKSYREIEKYSSGAMRIPGPDASDEVKEAFLNKVSSVEGVMRTPDNYHIPESADAYKLSEVEGFKGDESVGELKTMGHQLGMTQAQVDGIHGWLANGVVANETASAAQTMEGFAELKGQWGAAYEQKLQGVENTIQTLSQHIGGIENAERTPEFAKLMDWVGTQLGESGVVKQDPRTQMTPTEARQKIDEIEHNTKHLAHPDREGEPGHIKARQALMELYRTAARR